MQRKDKSNIGAVDKPIEQLIDIINSKENYYTTSSCSGRIILIQIPLSGSKREAQFIYRTHKKGDYKELKDSLKKYDSTEKLWFRQEPAIIHICAKDLKSASKLLRIARRIGFKRGGLFEVEKHLMIELWSTEKIETIIAAEGKILISEDYLKILIFEANKRLERTWEKTNNLCEAVKKL
ncbi:MAG: hypothetical protein KKH40_06085 [Nanoarchaeota archaeon]|nr:hypothetical protein [Nanoarchaeota archaeon]